MLGWTSYTETGSNHLALRLSPCGGAFNLKRCLKLTVHWSQTQFCYKSFPCHFGGFLTDHVLLYFTNYSRGLVPSSQACSDVRNMCSHLLPSFAPISPRLGGVFRRHGHQMRHVVLPALGRWNQQVGHGSTEVARLFVKGLEGFGGMEGISGMWFVASFYHIYQTNMNKISRFDCFSDTLDRSRPNNSVLRHPW